MNSDLQTDRRIDIQTDRHKGRQTSSQIDTVRLTMINRDRKCKTLTVKNKSHKKAKLMNSDRQTDRKTDIDSKTDQQTVRQTIRQTMIY